MVEDIFFGLQEQLVSVGGYVGDLSLALGTVLVAAAVIWMTALVWRKYKESCDKV